MERHNAKHSVVLTVRKLWRTKRLFRLKIEVKSCENILHNISNS